MRLPQFFYPLVIFFASCIPSLLESRATLLFVGTGLVLSCALLGIFTWRCTARIRRGARAFLMIFLLATMTYGCASVNVLYRISKQMSVEYENVDIAISGLIVSLPERMQSGYRFELKIETASQNKRVLSEFRHQRLRLSWRTKYTQDLDLHQTYYFLVRLKRPRGFVNPDSFDYHAWLLYSNYFATGYVLRRSLDSRHLASDVR